jgi:hypothetical protein
MRLAAEIAAVLFNSGSAPSSEAECLESLSECVMPTGLKKFYLANKPMISEEYELIRISHEQRNQP